MTNPSKAVDGYCHLGYGPGNVRPVNGLSIIVRQSLTDPSSLKSASKALRFADDRP
jgi:hypothetical protein